MKLLAPLAFGLLLAAGVTTSSAHAPPRPAPQPCAALTGYSYSPALPRQTLISTAVLNPATAHR